MMSSIHMLEEISQIPSVLSNAAERQTKHTLKLKNKLAGSTPRLVATIGRGSSDHVATFLRYAFEITLGIPSASIAPSVASIYGRQLNLEGALCLVISQSGRSPDIRQAAAMARNGGATVVAIVNDEQSPLMDEVDFVLPIAAGPELAVAATKSFLGAAVAGLRLLATLGDDHNLHDALNGLPHSLHQTLQSWQIDLEPVLSAQTAFVVGRGPALGIVQEAALKLKEIVKFPAEAYSSAEVLHGPWQLADTNCGLIAWHADSAALAPQRSVIESFRALGRPVVDLQGIETGENNVGHELLGPLLPLPTFYKALVSAAQRRALDPDRPNLLRKVTETV